MKATKSWLYAVALVAAPGLAGCGGSSSSGTAASPPTLTPRSVFAALSNGLTATLAEDRSSVSVGGTVNYTATLTNSTTQPITYQPVLSGTNSFSVPAGLVVGNPSGQTVYPLEAFAQYVAVGPSVTLAPGQSVSTTEAVGSGTYSHAGQYIAQVTFSITAGTPQENNRPPVIVGPLTVSAH